MTADTAVRRTRWRVVAVSTLTLVATLLAAAWCVAPALIRRYVETHYPGVRVRTVSITLHEITLHDVAIDRPGTTAHLPLVRVGSGEAIGVEGGEASVDLTHTNERSGNSKHRLSGWLDVVHVVKGDVTANGTKVTIEESKFCAERGDASHPKAVVSGTHVCVHRGKNSLTAETVSITPSFKLPFDKLPIPPPLPTTITANGVEVDPKEGWIFVRSMSFGPLLVFAGRATLVERLLDLSAEKVTLNLPVLHATPITLRTVATRLDLADLLGEIPVYIGPARLTVRPIKLSLEGDASCQAWIDALPVELRTGPLTNLRMEGRLSFSLSLKAPAPTFTMKADCHASCDVFRSLSERFTYVAYDAGGKEFERTSGPGSKDWTPIGEVSPTLPAAVMSTEDPGFLGHKGIIPEAIENSLRDDLKADKFVRGGSTLTMQLVKNVWLRRTKTLGRKTQEVLLALGLESCVTKDRIMEIYLNVVEFGPNLYGVGPAARHYFGESAMTLDPVRSYYLASILPAPRKAAPPNAETLARIRALMIRVSKESGHLSDTFGAPDAQDEEGWVVGAP